MLRRTLALSSVCDGHRSLSRNRRTNPTVMGWASKNTTKRNIFHSYLSPEELCVLWPQVPSPPASSDCSLTQYSSANSPSFKTHFILANKTLLDWLDHFIFPIIWEMHLDKGTFIELSFITQVFLPKKDIWDSTLSI